MGTLTPVYVPSQRHVSEIILEYLQHQFPDAPKEELLAAEDLFAAGLDSSRLLELVVRIEQETGLQLDDEQLTALSQTPVQSIAESLEGRLAPARLTGMPLVHAWRLGSLARAYKQEIVKTIDSSILLFGASCIEFNFDAHEFERHLPPDLPYRAFNFALYTMRYRGILEVVQFLARNRPSPSARFPLILVEFDPAAAVLPQIPGVDHLVGDVLELETSLPPLAVPSDPARRLWTPESPWTVEGRGCRPFGLLSETSIDRLRAFYDPLIARANVPAKRAAYADVFNGRCEITLDVIDDFVALYRALQEIAVHVDVFANPISKALKDSLDPPHANNSIERTFDAVTAGIGFRPRWLTAEEMGLTDDMWFNAYHLAPHLGGPQVYSRYLARMVSERLQSAEIRDQVRLIRA